MSPQPRLTREQMDDPVYDKVKKSTSFRRYLEKSVQEATRSMMKKYEALQQAKKSKHKPPQTDADYFTVLRQQSGQMDAPSYDRFMRLVEERAIDDLRKQFRKMRQEVKKKYKAPQTGEDYFNALKGQRGGWRRSINAPSVRRQKSTHG